MDMPWHVHGAYEYGYVRMDTSNDTLTVQYIRNEDGSVADEIQIPSRY